VCILSEYPEWCYALFVTANLSSDLKQRNNPQKPPFCYFPSPCILDLLRSQWNKSNTFKQFFNEFRFSVNCHKFSEQYHHSGTWKFPSVNHKSSFRSLSFSSVFLLLRDSGMEMATTPYPVS